MESARQRGSVRAIRMGNPRTPYENEKEQPKGSSLGTWGVSTIVSGSTSLFLADIAGPGSVDPILGTYTIQHENPLSRNIQFFATWESNPNESIGELQRDIQTLRLQNNNLIRINTNLKREISSFIAKQKVLEGRNNHLEKILNDIDSDRKSIIAESLLDQTKIAILSILIQDREYDLTLINLYGHLRKVLTELNIEIDVETLQLKLMSLVKANLIDISEEKRTMKVSPLANLVLNSLRTSKPNS